MSKHTIHKVAEFHRAFGHPVAPYPTAATRDLRELRVRLIAEELTELCEALGVAVQIISNGESSQYVCEAVKGNDEVDLAAAADALGDLDYVVQGANLVFGFPAEAVMDEIHHANMSKLGEDGRPIYREDGKIMKGPNYTPPDVDMVLREHIRSHGLLEANEGEVEAPAARYRHALEGILQIPGLDLAAVTLATLALAGGRGAVKKVPDAAHYRGALQQIIERRGTRAVEIATEALAGPRYAPALDPRPRHGALRGTEGNPDGGAIPVKCDGDHGGPPCEDADCWHRDPPEREPNQCMNYIPRHATDECVTCGQPLTAHAHLLHAARRSPLG